jgi:hypothetical protein
MKDVTKLHFHKLLLTHLAFLLESLSGRENRIYRDKLRASEMERMSYRRSKKKYSGMVSNKVEWNVHE